MNDITAVRDLLASHDPLAFDDAAIDDVTIDAIWQRLVDDVEQGAQPGVRPPLPRHVRVAARSAAAVVAVLACVLGTLVAVSGRSPSTHYVALEPLNYSRAADPAPAAAVLDALATAAQAQPPLVTGGWYYLETASWSMFAASSERAQPPGMPNVLEKWTNLDGAQRRVSHSDLPAPPQGVNAWLAAGLPLAQGHAEVRTTIAAQRQFPATLSSDPAVLKQQLLQAEMGSGGAAGGVDELFTAVRDLRAAQPIEPATQAALLRMLANEPGVMSLGTATDRLGRVVDAVAIDSDRSGLPARDILLFDSTDGQLLGAEVMLTRSAGNLHVPIPSVISYVIYVRDGHVRNDTSVPPPP